MHSRPPRRHAGFTFTDLLVTMALIAVMLSVHATVNAGSRSAAQRMQNSTQLRGIHQALVTFANSNRNNFPGLTSYGQILVDGRDTGNSGAGDTVQARYWLLLTSDFITPDYAISPLESADMTPYNDLRDAGPVLWEGRGVRNYSFAFLGYQAGDGEGDSDDAGLPIDLASVPRVAEWQQTLNSQAIVVSDRNTGLDERLRVNSIHTDRRGQWQGSVLWNDNHVGFEETQYFQTKYANGLLNDDRPGDNLFFDESPQYENQIVGANALMVIAGNNTVHAAQ